MPESVQGYIQRTRRLFRTRRQDESEIAGYIHAFTQSSDRVRQTIIVITTICILIFVANWNIHPASWARTRMRKASEQELQRRTDANAANPARPLPKDREEALQTIYIEQVLKHYAERYVEDVLLVEIPAVGISTDVNEIGILGGVTLSLLMYLLLRALKRQHENLYLSIFKIHRLFEHDGSRADGESRANYLYHSLAMSQVLSTPPTLARWTIQGRKQPIRMLLKSVFIVPAALQVWVASSNYFTGSVPRFYFGRILTWKLAGQFMLALILFGFGVACFIHSRALDKRWRGAFFLINPQHKALRAAAWTVWTKLRSRWSRGEKRLRRKLEDVLLLKDQKVGEKFDKPGTPIEIDEQLALHELTRKTVRIASHHVMKVARAKALRWCNKHGHQFVEMQAFAINSCRLAEKVLTLAMTWRFHSIPIMVTESERSRPRKLWSIENTFAKAIPRAEVEAWIREQSEWLWVQLEKHGMRGRTVTVKLRTPDFKTATLQLTPPEPPASAEEIAAVGIMLLDRFAFALDARYGLAGIGLSKFNGEDSDEVDEQSALSGA